MVPGVVPSMVPSMVPGADRAATVLLPQAVEARHQDEGPEPEARWQVRGWDAPSAEPLAEPGCPALMVSAVTTDPGANGSRWSRPRAWAVLGKQDELHPGGTCLCAPGSPVPHERQSFSQAGHAPGRAAPTPRTKQEPWHRGQGLQRRPTVGRILWVARRGLWCPVLWLHGDLEASEWSCLSWRMGREGCGNGLLSAESSSGGAGKAAHPSIPRRVGWQRGLAWA